MKTIRTPEDFSNLLDEAAERVKASRLTDDRFTTRFWVSRRLMFEAVLIGHIRALEVGYGLEYFKYWAAHTSNCFENRQIGMNNTLELLPLTEKWLRNYPGYAQEATKLGIDIDAAIQNIGTYLREHGAMTAAHEGDLKTFHVLIDLPGKEKLT